MKIIDIVIPAIVFIAALAYLYRIFFVKRGCSCGSSSCLVGQGGSGIKIVGEGGEEKNCGNDCSRPK